MTTGVVLVAVLVSLLIARAIAWTVKLAETIPAMHDTMPTGPGEPFFIILARQRIDKK